MRLGLGLAIWAVGGAAAGLLVASLLSARVQPLEISGAVVRQDADPRRQAPVANVEVQVADNLAAEGVVSDASGYFRLTLRADVAAGQLVTLSFRHPDYRPLDLVEPAGEALSVARLIPMRNEEVPLPPPTQQTEVSNVVIRYSIEARTVLNVGSGVKMFEVANKGNIPCDGHPPCSPDGKWKASIGSASLDAGEGNEFRNARASCIAGPCPFTRIDPSGFQRVSRIITVTVHDWSDTTTFVLQADVYHPELSDTIQMAYPVLLGRTLTFTLPAAAEGPTIEAELNGESIVFALGPTAILSWADCDVRRQRDGTVVYRCELKPDYRFR